MINLDLETLILHRGGIFIMIKSNININKNKYNDLYLFYFIFKNKKFLPWYQCQCWFTQGNVCLPEKGIHTSTYPRLCIAASFFIFQFGDANQPLII